MSKTILLERETKPKKRYVRVQKPLRIIKMLEEL